MWKYAIYAKHKTMMDDTRNEAIEDEKELRGLIEEALTRETENDIS